jgi:hypothetical protein
MNDPKTQHEYWVTNATFLVTAASVAYIASAPVIISAAPKAAQIIEESMPASNKVNAIVKSGSKTWGTLADGTNQGVKHFNSYWELYPERIPSIANRLGVDPSDFSNTVSGFENFTKAAQNVISNPNQVRTVGERTFYFVEGAQNANKGVTVITQGGKIQSMMPTALKDFLKLK